uniref:Uncharacterized protein n=1 Tax=viral metagenome TaxID=1070528 RepID=A0A6C0KPW5_9ZZZZ
MSAPRRVGQTGPPQQDEEPAIPLEPAVARARSAFIRSNLDKIIAMKAQGKSKEDIEAEVPRFSVDYPSLFKMVMKTDGYNEGSLKTMLAMLEKMGSGEFTQHQASVIVGQRLHDVYIKPKVPDMERKDETQ